MPGNPSSFRPSLARRWRSATQASSAPAASTGGNTMALTKAQPKRRQQLAGGERADRHGAENQEIVERLDLVALLRPVALGHQRGGADEGEIPADPEQHQPDPEMGDDCAGQADRGADQQQRQPERDDPVRRRTARSGGR